MCHTFETFFSQIQLRDVVLYGLFLAKIKLNYELSECIENFFISYGWYVRNDLEAKVYSQWSSLKHPEKSKVFTITGDSLEYLMGFVDKK